MIVFTMLTITISHCDTESSPNGSAGPVIIWAFDDECRAIVQEIRPVQEGEAEPAEGGQSESPTPSGTIPGQSSDDAYAASSVETKRGWVKYVIVEQFDIPATLVYAEMRYEDYGDTVGGGHDPHARCWASSFPVWTIEDCFSSYYPHGPDYVWIEVTGEFSHSLPIEYTQYAQWYGTSNGYSYQCSLIEGELPPFWEEFCYGDVID